jgi:hypothetical protein
MSRNGPGKLVQVLIDEVWHDGTLKAGDGPKAVGVVTSDGTSASGCGTWAGSIRTGCGRARRRRYSTAIAASVATRAAEIADPARRLAGASVLSIPFGLAAGPALTKRPSMVSD